jgi:putative endopeptidase
MRIDFYVFLLLVALSGSLAQADAPPSAPDLGPLEHLPYTPSLDVTSMDRSVNACADFYRYACGGWIAHNPIPSDQPGWNVYRKLSQDNQRFLWGILADLARATPRRSASQQKIGDYFGACMDESAIEQRGLHPLDPTLAAIDALKSVADLPVLLARLQLQNGSGEFLFHFQSNQDFENSASVIAFADAGGLGMPDRDYYTDKDQHAQEMRAKYLAHLERSFDLLGEDARAARADAAMVLRLETSLARASLTRVERRDPYKLFHKMDAAALARLTPHFAWSPFLQALQLQHVDTFNVSEPQFYAALEQLLASVSVADLRTYLRWHALNGASPYLARAFEDERFAFFDHTLRGVPAQRPRWKRCVAQVDRLLGEALGQEYVARTFGPKLKDATLAMTRQIEAAMRRDLEGLTWMSATTKQQALAKLASLVNKIGYPDHWRDYSSVHIDRADYFGNAQRAIEFESHRELNKIGKPLDRSEWDMTPQTVNAYYDPQMNDINFPAAVLQPPLYDPRLDDAPNYGDTGGTIGHELTHGFDDQGRQFDAAGNLKDWWTKADAQRFEVRTKCIIDQYAKYVVVDDIHLNSRLTLGEDVADLGGLILARMAWLAQTAGQKPPARDGLSPEQRFFVGYAQWACGSDRPEYLRLRAKTDPHSPDRYRVNGLVVNMPEFARAFSCPADAPLTKKEPCRVW